MTSPHCVGGPDFPQQPEDRRRFDDAPAVSLHTFTEMMAARCEYQFRADWDLNPGLLSLSFATKVNQGMSMSIQRALRRGAHSIEEDLKAGEAAARIYTLLWKGEYLDVAGRRHQIAGDITKIPYAIGLNETEKLYCKTTISCQAASQALAKSDIIFDISSSAVACSTGSRCS